jgi:hypothetical protein
MMRNVNRVLVCAALAALVLPTLAFGQLPPDGSLWTEVSNPDGSRAVPAVVYDPSTGMLTVDTSGLNGMVDTATGGAIGGDDVGFISLVVEGPEPLDILLGDPSPDFRGTNDVGTNWTGTYFSGKLQTFGATIVDQYLLPIGITEVAVYATGLGPDDFPAGTAEMGLNFAAGAPGATTFGSVQIVPEPAALCLVGTALMALVGFVRRR